MKKMTTVALLLFCFTIVVGQNKKSFLKNVDFKKDMKTVNLNFHYPSNDTYQSTMIDMQEIETKGIYYMYNYVTLEIPLSFNLKHFLHQPKKKNQVHLSFK